jgi:hypothetical protein
MLKPDVSAECGHKKYPKIFQPKAFAMSKPDQFVVFILSCFILIQIAISIIGKLTGKFIVLVGISNLIIAFLFTGYWTVRYFQVQVQTFDIWITILLLAEISLILLTAYSMMVHYASHLIRFIQYSFFGFHLLASVSFLVFMLSFKMNRLF